MNVSWVRSSASGLLLTVSPFYHFNRAHYIGGRNDPQLVPEDDRGSQYAARRHGAVDRGPHTASPAPSPSSSATTRCSP